MEVTLTFKDGTTLTPLSFSKGQKYFQKADRETATFTFGKNTSTFTDLKELFKNENKTAEMKVHTKTTVYPPAPEPTPEDPEPTPPAPYDVEEDFLLEDFVILSQLNYRENSNEDDDSIPIFTLEMARLSVLEKEQRNQTAIYEENMDAIIELAAIIG